MGHNKPFLSRIRARFASLLRACLQRLLISSCPAPSGNEGYTSIMSDVLHPAAADALSADRSDAGSDTGSDTGPETRSRAAARLASAPSADSAASASLPSAAPVDASPPLAGASLPSVLAAPIEAPPLSAPVDVQTLAALFGNALASVMQQSVPPPAPPRGPTVAPQAYRIDSNEHAPGTILVNQVRVPPGFSFSKETTQRSVADWLNLVEHFCVSFRVAHPVAMASTHLQDAALHWFLTWLDTRDPHTISWSDFRAAMLASPLVDPGSVQALLDQHRSLTQGSRGVLEYVRTATALRQRGSTHRFLKDYPEHFWLEGFRAGLKRDLQARMPALTESTTFADYTTLAVNIGRPLETSAAGGGHSRWPRRSGGGTGASPTVAALAPPAAFADDEQALAQWEREHLKGPERREARLKRQACTFCGISGHRANQCPAKSTPSVNAVAHQDILVDTENGGGAAY